MPFRLRTGSFDTFSEPDRGHEAQGARAGEIDPTPPYVGDWFDQLQTLVSLVSASWPFQTFRRCQTEISEKAYGRSQSEEKIAALYVPLVIGSYGPPVETWIDAKAGPGYQGRGTSWGAQVFDLPRPYLNAGHAVTS